jgi:peptidoglycan/xylan/chitin deacetylase (PgdA/CDA1 family)
MKEIDVNDWTRRDFVGYGRHRPKVRWPDGAAVVVNFCIAYEEGAERSVLLGDSEGESLGPGRSVPSGSRDLAVESVFEYGSRAGIWRIARILQHYGVPATLFAAGMALERNPEVCRWIRETGNDVCAHGYRWLDPIAMSEEEEREQIRRAVESIRETTGRPPAGWRTRTGPTIRTRRLLVEHGGFLYDSDSYNDDLPYELISGSQRHLVIPYTLTYSEGRLIQPLGFTSPVDFWDTCIAGLEELHKEGLDGEPKMMSIGLHPRHTGQAGRVGGLRRFIERAQELGSVRFMRREDIAVHWRKLLENVESR